jgi:oligoribonuclease (3'-5' exoribonuclease)
VRALPAVIWVDDQVAGYGIENETLSEITAITFDRSLIHDGAVISLSYGETKDDRIRFTQKLQLKTGGENQ